MDELASLFTSVSVAAGVGAIFGAGMLVLAPGFARWLTDKVATFFDPEDDDGDAEDGEIAMCDFCGEEVDLETDDSNTSYGGLMCSACSRDDSRWA